MKLFIDGDGSPVKQDVYTIGESFGLPVVVVTSMDHYTNQKIPRNVSMIYVDKGLDAADFRLISEITKDDILITQDYGLASIALAKKVVCLHQRGLEYKKENIDSLLNERYLGQMRRKVGQRTKGPKPFTKEDHDNFQQKLIELIQRATFEKKDCKE